ncbi:hypothetical protein [Thermoflexibacter ruber]|uniref:DUF4190 domain-containing protein n=1 Tax=Thermoflexibacter ruber TaxID=1003 RepID=A0A1I2ADX1_9BACT|nr:hypothetical protein [Thermoflexibacter ruber]SFE41748.1 hypothetical protein SAMN04488541_1001120 [Thermoflexibacter ruber]
MKKLLFLFSLCLLGFVFASATSPYKVDSSLVNKQLSYDVLKNLAIQQKNAPLTLKEKLALRLVAHKLKKQDDRPMHWSGITSFGAGLLSVLLVLLFPLAGLVLSVIGMTTAIIGFGKTGSRKDYKGKGWAWTGFIFSLLVLLFFVLGIVLLNIISLS